MPIAMSSYLPGSKQDPGWVHKNFDSHFLYKNLQGGSAVHYTAYKANNSWFVSKKIVDSNNIVKESIDIELPNELIDIFITEKAIETLSE